MSKIHHFFNTKNSSLLKKLDFDRFGVNNIRVYVKRDDLLHPFVSGNKWRKLKYNLLEAEEKGHKTLLTFGGAFSNHIAAVAAAGSEFDFKTIGIIRGEKVEPLNPTLAYATQQGMELHFVSRTDYKKRSAPDFIKKFEKQFGTFYHLPEGGTNHLAIKGCSEIIEEINSDLMQRPDYICAPCGTGGTLAGLIAKADPATHILGFSALKGDFLKEEIKTLLSSFDANHSQNWSLNTDYHFGGYAKWTPELVNFINEKRSKIILDPIYTGKMFFGIFDLIQKGFFKSGSTIVALHTGGLQGIEGFNQRFGQVLRAK